MAVFLILIGPTMCYHRIFERDRVGIEQYLHRVRLYRELGFTEAGRHVASHLLVSDRPINVSSMSELTAYSRRTIRLHLRDYVKMGLVTYQDGGYFLTRLGFRLFLTINAEAADIASGKQHGWFSEALQEQIRDLPGNKRPFKLQDD